MRGFYINLDRRTDRRAEIEKELEGLAMERFPAVSHPNGAIGCTMSHLACLKLARERGQPEVFIFEDDFMWIGERQIPPIPADSDVCCLAHNTSVPVRRSLWNPNQGNPPGWTRCKNIQTTAGYMVRSKMQDTLIHCWEESLIKFLETGDVHTYSLDQQWKPLQNTLKFQCATPRLGKQRPSQSDICQMQIDNGGV